MERIVRALVASINTRITYINSHTTTGPPSTLAPLDAERVVARWRGDVRPAGS